MRKYIIKSNLAKLSVLGLVAVGSVSGIYFTYQQGVAAVQAPAIVASSENPVVNEEAGGQEIPSVDKPGTVENGETAGEKTAENDLIQDRKENLASTETPSRSKTATAAESKEPTAPSASPDKEQTKTEDLQTAPAQTGDKQEKPQTTPSPDQGKQEEPQTKPSPSQGKEEPTTTPSPSQGKEEPKTPENKSTASETKSKYDTTLNSYVLNIIKTYPIGSYPYLLNNDYANYNGVTVNLFYQGQLLLKAHPSGKKYSHCSGITFEVFFKAMQERNKKLGISPDDFNGMTYDELYDFVLTWYVADGNKRTQNVAKAVEKYGIGKRITRLEDAKAGDFMDISRENNTGHTVVFLNWIRDDAGKIIGFKYWSSQESTQGISYKEEYFNVTDANGKKYGNVMTNHVYISRISAVKDNKNYK